MEYYTTEDLRLVLEHMPENYILVDVRNSEEWALGVIEGAMLLSLPLLPLHVQEFSPEKIYIFICRSGARSGQAATWLKEHGIPHVINCIEGMLGWNEAKLPIVLPHHHRI